MTFDLDRLLEIVKYTFVQNFIKQCSGSWCPQRNKKKFVTTLKTILPSLPWAAIKVVI